MALIIIIQLLISEIELNHLDFYTKRLIGLRHNILYDHWF
jgi:hypothetical protein